VTAVPDRANRRLLVYSSSSEENCPGIDIIEVPLANPAEASYVRAVSGKMMCHDIGVILGDAMKAACAGHHGPQVYSIGGAGGGALDNLEFLWDAEIEGVDPGHSAASTWDGEILVFGWVSKPREIAWSDPDPLPLVPEFEIAPGVVTPNPLCEGVGCRDPQPTL
jgi:hypothetical protein